MALVNEDHAYYSPQWVTNSTCATDADCVGMEYCDLNWHNSVCACTMESDARGDGCFERGPLYAWAVTMSVFSALLYLLYAVQSARVLWIIRERTDGKLLASRQATPVMLVLLCGACGLFPHVSRLVAHAAHMRYTAWSLVHYLCLFGAFWFGLLAVLVVTMRWIEIAGKTQSFGITQMNRVKKALLIYTAFFSVVYIALIVALFVPGIDAPLVRAGFLGWTILNIIVLIVLMTVGSQRLGHLLARSVAMKEGSLTGAGGARLQRGVTVGAKEVFKQARESVKSKRMSLARAWSGGGSQNKKAAAESSAEALTVEMYEMRQLKSIAWTARRVRAGLAAYVVAALAWTVAERLLRNIFAYYVLLTLLYYSLAPTLLGIVQSQERLVVREERRRKSLPPIPTAESLASSNFNSCCGASSLASSSCGVSQASLVSSTTSSGTQSKSHRSSTSSQAQKTPRGSCFPMVPEGTEERV